MVAFVVLFLASVGALAALMIELGGDEPRRGGGGGGDPGRERGDAPPRPSLRGRVAARAAQARRRSSADGD